MVTTELLARANHVCELCGADKGLAAVVITNGLGSEAANSILCCEICCGGIAAPDSVSVEHWRCLNDSMWSQEPAVQIAAWRILDTLAGSETWARDALDMLYLDDVVLALAKATQEDTGSDGSLVHKDSNGIVLSTGDTVVLIKDLNVKGASFTAKRGTAVRRISLVPDNASQIEGRVNDQQIVILTQFVKKA